MCLWYVRSRFGTDQSSFFSAFCISLNAHQPFKSQRILNMKSCWTSYCFSDKFINRNNEELLPGSTDNHVFVTVRYGSFSYAPESR